jgi:O-acetyl-ADP-ribose deacetylase
MQVHVTNADITTLPVDAIVNPANSLGIMDRGVAASIREQGGESIQDETMAKAPVPVGAAMLTSAGRLPAKFVIHAPTMEKPGMKIGAENIRRATRAALIAAHASELPVIAVPAMGTGSGGISPEEATRAIVEEIRPPQGASRDRLPRGVLSRDRGSLRARAAKRAAARLAGARAPARTRSARAALTDSRDARSRTSFFRNRAASEIDQA